MSQPQHPSQTREQPLPNRRGPGRQIGTEKPVHFRRTMKTLWSKLKVYRLTFIFVGILAILSASFSVIGPKMMGDVTTILFDGLLKRFQGLPNAIDFAAIGRILAILVGLYLVSAVFNYVQNILMLQVSIKFTYQLRKDLAEKIDRLPLSYFDTHSKGDIISRVTNDIDTISTTLNQGMTEMVTSFVTVIGIIVVMLVISPIMTLVALLSIPLSLLVASLIIRRTQVYFKKRQDRLGQINGHVEEMLSGHQVVQSFNGQQQSIDTFESHNEDLYDVAWKAQFFSGMMMPILNVISNFGYVAVSILGGYLTIKQIIQIGDIQAFLQYVRTLNRPIMSLANVTNLLQQTASAAERVFEFLEEEEDHHQKVNDPVSSEQIQGNISFDHIYFGYEKDTPIIQDFSSDIQAGEKIAIVGPTGAGKTTIVKLLMHFYELDAGTIWLDGIDYKRFSKDELRKQMAIVLQDTWLFHGTVFENIHYGDLSASEEAVFQAAKAAHVDQFVRVLPGGYDMMINEESSNLSEGQKQLITIARAILADPKILIFDEATSSVDTRTEWLIQQSMQTLMQGRTSFIIAHRLSTIKDADRILVLEEGNIVEQGSHHELLAKQGAYAKLYMSQFDVAAS